MSRASALRSLWRLVTLRTVMARILCVLILGLLLIQVGSFSLVTFLNERDTRARMLNFMAADVAFVYQVLQPKAEHARAALVPALNRGFYTLHLGAPLADEVLVPPGRLPALEAVSRRVGASLGRSDVHWVFQGDDAVMVLPLSANQSLYIDAKDPFPAPSVTALVGYSLVITVAVSILGIFAVRIALAPMRRFIHMAQRLGRDIAGPPLKETGPLEMRRMASVLNHMQGRLRRQMDQRVQIVAAVSHDLQTPVTRLRLRADTIDDPVLRQRFIADLDQISELVRDALGFVRSAALSEAHTPVDLNAMVESIVSDMCDVGKDASADGHVRQPYVGARRALHRALQNIIENALKFGKRAQVSLADDSRGVHIRVQDDGPGIPPGMLETVFEPFLRMRTADNAHLDGTGLGLSIARNLVAAHRGRIVLSNRVEGGIEAYLFLPWPDDDRKSV